MNNMRACGERSLSRPEAGFRFSCSKQTGIEYMYDTIHALAVHFCTHWKRLRHPESGYMGNSDYKAIQIFNEYASMNACWQIASAVHLYLASSTCDPIGQNTS